MRLWPALVLLLASSLTALAGAIVAPALPGLRAAFVDQPGVELLSRLVLTAPALAVALGASRMGRWIDRVGGRPVLIGGLVVYGIGGTSGLWLPTLPLILAGRLLLGLGVAAVMTAATALIAELASEQQRGRLMGLQAASMALGALVFLTLGGRLADLGWSYPFAAYAVAWLLVPGVLVAVPATKPRAPERTRPVALPRCMLVLSAAAFVGMALFYLVPVQVPFLLQQRLGASGSAIGLELGVLTAAGAVGSLLSARLQRRWGSRRVLVATFALMAPGLLLTGYATGWVTIAAGLALIGLGLGNLMPNLTVWTTRIVLPAQRGQALGQLTTALFLGQFLSPVLSSPVLATGHDIGQLLALAGLVAIAAALAALAAPWARGWLAEARC